MTEFREPLEVPVARTLLALLHWPSPRNVRAQPDFNALATMDFLLRFPAVLEAAFADRGRDLPVGARAQLSERLALENEQPVAQLAIWPSQHRLAVGALLGRALARPQPAVAGSGLTLTADGGRIAAALTQRPEWAPVSLRAEALGRRLRVGAPSLHALARRSAAQVQRAGR